MKIFKGNIGFYCMFILCISQIIFLAIYLIKKVKPLRYYMLIFQNKNQEKIKSTPPPKNNTNNNFANQISNNEEDKPIFESKNYDVIFDKAKNYIKNKIIGNNIIIEDKENNENDYKNKNKIQFMDEENIIQNKNNEEINSKADDKINNRLNKLNGNIKLINNYNSNINIENIKVKNKISKSTKTKININNKFIKRKLKHDKNKNNNKKSDRHINNNILETTEINNKKNNIKKKVDQDIIVLSRSDEDLQDMEYEYAIIYDKSSYLRICWAFLIDTQIILGTFCTENYLHLFIIKLSFLVFNFQISLFLNAFFYTDEYISDAYHNDGLLDFISGLPKTIYSFMVTIIITNLLRKLSNSKEELKRIIRKEIKNKDYLYIIDFKL